MANRKRPSNAPPSESKSPSPGGGLPWSVAPKHDEGMRQTPGIGFCSDAEKGTGPG